MMDAEQLDAGSTPGARQALSDFDAKPPAWSDDVPEDEAKRAEEEIRRTRLRTCYGWDEETFVLRRKELAKELRLPVADLDKLRRRARGEKSAAAGEEATRPFPEDAPAEGPQDGALLLAEIAERINRHMRLPEHADVAVVLWILWAWSIEAFSVAPMLYIASPERACGKSRLLELVAALSPRAVVASNVSTAYLFRVIDRYGCSIFIDEADTFLRENQELGGAINGSYLRRTAFVGRVEGDEHQDRTFRTYGPKVIAGLANALRDTTASRCLTILLERKLSNERVERMRADRMGWADDLRSRAARWSADNLDELRASDAEVPEGLDDRSADNWRPLLAVADCAGGTWPTQAREAARALTRATPAAPIAAETELLADAKALFEKLSLDKIGAQRLAEELNQQPEGRWRDWGRGKGITPHKIARILDKYSVRSRRESDARYYHRADFLAAWERYLPEADGFAAADGGIIAEGEL